METKRLTVYKPVRSAYITNETRYISEKLHTLSNDELLNLVHILHERINFVDRSGGIFLIVDMMWDNNGHADEGSYLEQNLEALAIKKIPQSYNSAEVGFAFVSSASIYAKHPPR